MTNNATNRISDRLYQFLPFHIFQEIADAIENIIDG